jgi:hypothetical protein
MDNVATPAAAVKASDTDISDNLDWMVRPELADDPMPAIEAAEFAQFCAVMDRVDRVRTGRMTDDDWSLFYAAETRS